MKIKTDFITNSSSSCFIVSVDSEYFKSLSQFNEKKGWSIGRGTGVYLGQHLEDFAHDALRDGYPTVLAEEVVIQIAKKGLENIALIMISDEGMGGWLPDPPDEDTIFETEYH